ncbi:MAG: DNA polymerase III subunit delta [Myxococcales bacterium]
MAELSDLLEEARAGKGKPVYLVEGDEYLARTAARELAEALVPEHDRALNLLVLDASAGAREIATHLVTVAMFAAPKAVVVEGADAFATEVDAERELARVRELCKAKRQRDAARRLLKLVGAAGWQIADAAFGAKGAASAAKWRKEIGAAPEEADKALLQELCAHAEEQRLRPPPDDLDALVSAIDRGLPPRTHVILVAEGLPQKHPLVRLATAKGALLRRKAERRGRGIDTLDISEVVKEVLGPLGKRLSREADLELKQRVGDDLRLLANELAKLAVYAGDRPLIGREDVEAIVAPVREEEFFAVGEAVQEGDLGRAISLLHDELRRTQNATSVVLPFLGAVAAAVRRSLADHARYASIPQASGPRELAYNDFLRSVFPAVEAELSQKGQKVPNPFVAWLGYKRSRRRPRGHWRRSLLLCAEGDFALKTGADPRLLAERLLTQICGAR